MKLRNHAWGGAALIVSMLPAVPDLVAAQQSASTSPMLEEIVVTARRREENLLELPLSVVAISADAMRAQGIYNIDDVGDYVPNLAFETADRRHVKAVYIRGIGNDSPAPLVSVGTGIYLDGHYLPNTVGQMMSTVDIERVEVLRGPQGTLFGKNTTGGAINIVSAKPQDEFAADLLLRVAEFGQQDVRGMINVPFTDSIAGRFSAAKEVSDGYYFNRTLNRSIGATDLEAFGAAIRITPDENWLVDLAVRANYQSDDDVGGQCRARPTELQVTNLANMDPGVLDAMLNDPAEYARIVANHPAQIYTGPVFDDGANQWGGATRYPDGTRANIGGHLERLYPGATIDYWNACTADNQRGDFVNSQEKDTYLDLDNENINATIQWNSAGELGALDDLTVKLIAARHEMTYNYAQDRDLSFLPVDAIGTRRGSPGSQRKTTTVELLLTADVSDRTSLTFGTHYFDDEALAGAGDCLNVLLRNFASIRDANGGSFPCESDGGTRNNFMPGRQVPGGPPEAGIRSGNIVNESLALYGHLTFGINDNWTLDVGARYTDEDRIFNQVEFPGQCSSVPPFLPTTELCRVNLELSFGSVFDAGLYNDASANFSQTTPLVSLTRNLGGPRGLLDVGMVYFRYAEGFLSGSFNDELQVTVFPELAPLVPYGPEHVNNYEAGFKGTFAGGRLRLSSTVFYMDYEDKQESACFDNSNERFGTRAFLCFVTNVASVDIYGMELELRANPWDGGFVSLDMGYLQNEYGEFTAFDPDTGADVDFSNLTIRDYSPEWTVSASIEHTFTLGDGGTLTPRLAAYYQSEYDFLTGVAEGSPPSFCLQDSYTRFQARLTYAPPTESWQASLFGYNIGDERYFDFCDSGRSGVFNYRYGVPAQWGVEFNYRWGG